MFDSVIVGGGIHGTLLQLALIRQRKRAPVVIDSEAAPLAVWKRNTAACGVKYLRSSSSHSLELDFHALRRFAREHGYGSDHFIPPYLRPSLELFNDHCDTLVARYGLDDRIQDRIEEIRAESQGFLLIGNANSYRARTVILAPGTPPPVLPWPQEGIREPTRALHVFDPRFSLESIAREESVAIVGCGVTGGQLAVALAARGVRQIRMIDVHEPTQADYDGNPCYVGPKCAGSFESIRSAEERREVIRLQRYPGTLPQDIYTEVIALRDAGKLTVETGRVHHLSQVGDRIELQLGATASAPVLRSFDRVVAATGFAAIPPAHRLISSIAEEHQLPRGPQGYPFPDQTLQWMPGLFVAGSLGELRIGPPARNIIGAHLAARRILPAMGAYRIRDRSPRKDHRPHRSAGL